MDNLYIVARCFKNAVSKTYHAEVVFTSDSYDEAIGKWHEICRANVISGSVEQYAICVFDEQWHPLKTENYTKVIAPASPEPTES